MTTTPEQIEAVAKRLLQHFLFLYLDKNRDPYEWEDLPQDAQDRLREIANDAIDTMRPFIRAEVLEEAAVVVETHASTRVRSLTAYAKLIVTVIKALREKKDV